MSLGINVSCDPVEEEESYRNKKKRKKKKKKRETTKVKLIQMIVRFDDSIFRGNHETNHQTMDSLYERFF